MTVVPHVGMTVVSPSCPFQGKMNQAPLPRTSLLKELALPRHNWHPLIALLLVANGAVPASAEVAVFSNRTPQRLTVTVLPDGERPQPLTLAVGESRPFFYQRALRVRYKEGLVEHSYQAAAKSAYFFTRGQGNEPLRMEQIGFGNN